jgi:hypothetical protein
MATPYALKHREGAPMKMQGSKRQVWWIRPMAPRF